MDVTYQLESRRHGLFLSYDPHVVRILQFLERRGERESGSIVYRIRPVDCMARRCMNTGLAEWDGYWDMLRWSIACLCARVAEHCLTEKSGLKSRKRAQRPFEGYACEHQAAPSRTAAPPQELVHSHPLA